MEDVTTIPFGITRVPNGDKPVGYEEIIEDGVDGKRIVTKDEKSGQVISDKTTHPKNQVVYFGTKEEETVSTPELPQEEVVKQPPLNTETHVESSTVPPTSDLIQRQGRFSTKQEIFDMKVTALKKAALEAARLLVFALPGILITVLTDNPSLGGSLGGTILLILKSLDRGIHENKDTPVKGLLPF